MILTIYKKDYNSVMRIMSFEFKALPNQIEDDIKTILFSLVREHMSLGDFLNIPINYLNIIPPISNDWKDIILTNVACISHIGEMIMFFAHPKHVHIAQ